MDTTNIEHIEQITTKQLHHARLKKALKLATAFAADWQALKLDYATNEDDSMVIGWKVTHTGGEDEITIYEGDELPGLAEVLETCQDLDLDPEEGAKEEKHSGSVVGENYRLRYAEVSSNGQTCGDWLAETLVSWTHSVADGFDVDAFRALIGHNGVDQTAKWAKLPESGQKGWIGRYRMNGRQALEKIVALNGVIYDPNGHKHEVPADELAALRSKHAKWLAKQEKLIELAKQDS